MSDVRAVPVGDTSAMRAREETSPPDDAGLEGAMPPLGRGSDGAFGALFATARHSRAHAGVASQSAVSDRVGLTARQDAEQMFEPQVQTPAARRSQMREQDFRSAVEESSNSVSGARRGVKARAAAQAQTGERTQASRQDSLSSSWENINSTQRELLNRANVSQEATGVNSPLVAHAQTQRLGQSNRADTRQIPGGTARAGALQVNPAASASAAAIQFSSERAGVTPAQRIGQMLAGSRDAGTAGQAGQRLSSPLPTPGAGEGLRHGSAPLATNSARGSATPGGQEASSPSPGRAADRESTTTTAAGSERKSERTEFDRLVQSIRLQVGDRRSSARLRLSPPELGRIRVDVRVNGDTIRVGLQAETAEAGALLSGRADRLRAGLAKYGIRVEQLEIVVDVAEGQSTLKPGVAERSSGSGATNAHSDGGQAGINAHGFAENHSDGRHGLLDSGFTDERAVSGNNALSRSAESGAFVADRTEAMFPLSAGKIGRLDVRI